MVPAVGAIGQSHRDRLWRAGSEITGRRARSGHRRGDRGGAWLTGGDGHNVVGRVGGDLRDIGGAHRVAERADGGCAVWNRGYARRQPPRTGIVAGHRGRRAKLILRAIFDKASLCVERGLGALRIALLRRSPRCGLRDKADRCHLGMHKDFHGIGAYRRRGGGDIGRGIGQAAGRGQRLRRAADGVIGDAAAGVPIPRAGADVAAGRDVHQLVVGGAPGDRSGGWPLSPWQVAAEGDPTWRVCPYAIEIPVVAGSRVSTAMSVIFIP